MLPGSCVPKIHPSFKAWFDLQKCTIAHCTFINLSLTRSCNLHLLINRSPENGSVVDVWVEDEVGSGVAKRKVVFHKLPLARVVGGLVKNIHGGKRWSSWLSRSRSSLCHTNAPADPPATQRDRRQQRCSPEGRQDSGPEVVVTEKGAQCALCTAQGILVNAHTVSIVRVAGLVFSSALRRPFFAPVSGA